MECDEMMRCDEMMGCDVILFKVLCGVVWYYVQ